MTSVTLPGSLRPRKGKQRRKELDEASWDFNIQQNLPKSPYLESGRPLDLSLPFQCFHTLHSVTKQLAVKADRRSDVPSPVSSKSDLAGNKVIIINRGKSVVYLGILWPPFIKCVPSCRCPYLKECSPLTISQGNITEAVQGHTVTFKLRAVSHTPCCCFTPPPPAPHTPDSWQFCHCTHGGISIQQNTVQQ